MDIQTYVEQNKATILATGRTAFEKLGRGALIVFPQRDEGNGRTGVRYLTQDVMEEDQDPSTPLIKTYNPELETILVVGIEHPKSILVYTVTENMVTVNLNLSDFTGPKPL